MRNQVSRLSVVLLITSVTVHGAEKLQIDTTVREVISYQTSKFVYRAIKGDREMFPYLWIEKLELGSTESDPDRIIKALRFVDLKGAEQFQVLEEGSKISSLRWQKEVLHFSITNKGKSWSCVASIETETLKCR